MRIILIDPNLINFAGHPVEFAQSLTNHAKLKEWDCILISNKKVKHPILGVFSDNFIPLISHSCFEDLTAGRDRFLEDLNQINQKIHFTGKDIVVVLTSYTNEISATNLYLRRLDNKSRPHFYFWVHQLFPPENDFMLASREERRKYWLTRFRKECSDLVDEIHFFSTPNKDLQQTLQEITNKKVGILSLPYSFLLEVGNSDDTIRDFKSFAFLGDGRYEKGASLFLHAVDRSRNLNARFLIQRANLRGFPKRELEIFNSLLEKLKKRKIIHMIDDDLPQQTFHGIIKNIDVLVFPYHPKSYDLRVSGLLVQALRIGKPVIVSSNTWLEEEVNRSKSGIVFDYDIYDKTKTVENFSTSIKIMLENLVYYTKNAIDASHIYRKTHSAKKFFKEILSEYDKGNNNNPNI